MLAGCLIYVAVTTVYEQGEFSDHFLARDERRAMPHYAIFWMSPEPRWEYEDFAELNHRLYRCGVADASFACGLIAGNLALLRNRMLERRAKQEKSGNE